MTDKLGIGIVGCGNISAAYFRLAPLFKGLEVRACTDLNMAVAEARAKEFGVRALTDGQAPRRRRDRRRHQPDHPRRALRGLLAGPRRRQARLFREALRAHDRGRPPAQGPGGRQGPARRLRARHLPRRRAPVRAQADRRRRARHRHRRHRLRDVARHGELASESGLLLPARRRPGARRRPLLRRRPHQPDRPGEARRRAHQHGHPDPHPRRRGPAQGPGDPGQDPDQRPRASRIRQRRVGDARRELGRLGAPAPQHRALRHRRRALRARPELVRRHGRALGPRRQDRRGHAVGAPLRGAERHPPERRLRQLPHRRPRRHGASPSSKAARRAARSTGRCTASTS